ncbi:hypothetical protein [Bacillus dakarensis]|uniref:hypothetical protein n=1 Tax=Robertmurraya dakarensis TaxID=1926278 RepID=UPI0009825045|nr:hypothetical protein [Bacillus dakarensis]
MGTRVNSCQVVTVTNVYSNAYRPCDGQEVILYDLDSDLVSAGGVITFHGGGAECTPTFDVYDQDGNVTTITLENNTTVARSFSSIRTVIGRCPFNPSGGTNCQMNIQGTLFFCICCQ